MPDYGESRRYFRFAAILCVLLFATSCASNYTNIAVTPPEDYEVLGPVEGKATGSLGILGTAYYAIPMGLNSRIEKAYQRALSSKPGATGLIDVTYKEDWFWWFIGTGRNVTVTGTAIKEKTQ